MRFFKGKKIDGLFSLPVLMGCLLLLPPSAYSDTYTLDADFDMGTLLNVNHDAPNNNQLQLNDSPEPFPFINVAASARGTMVRINTVTGEITGEYRTAPAGRGLNPSRTSVDLGGNVWATNRNESSPISIGGDPHGSAVKIGFVMGGTRVDADETVNASGDYLAPPFDYITCVDRNSDGLIKTSRGLGDIRPWTDITDGVGGTDGLVEDADDECILVYQRLPDAENARHVSVDADNNVWVGGYPFAQRTFHKLNGNTGAFLDSFDARDFGCGGYGGLIDGNGILWSASTTQNTLLRYDPATDTGSCISVSLSYGLGIDTSGYIWNSMWTNNTIDKISPAGVIEPGFPTTTGGASNDRGVAVTLSDDHVWVANSGGSDVSRLDNAGAVLKVIPVGSTPTGVAVDADGKVWVTCLNSNNAQRIDPNGGGDGLGAVDLIVDLGAGAGPYNYSDMTGIVILGAIQQGTWNVVYDSGIAGVTGCEISWNDEEEGDEPEGTSITVDARAADNSADLGSATFVAVINGSGAGVTGQYVEIRATLDRDPGRLSITPVLSDLTIICNQAPTADPNGPYLGPLEVCFDGTGSSDPDGDPLTYEWDFGDGNTAVSQDSPCHTYADADIYNVCLTVNDGHLSDTACTQAVVYDPSAGFVTGGGWIDSPAGAYTPDPLLEGKATFGFVSKYKKGATVPTGQTEFQFKMGALNFHSESYDFLVVTVGGTKAQFKGEGTINGEYDTYGSLYKFMIWATDDEPDTFRIKIWEEEDGGVEMVVYDNPVDQVISGGSIVIHTKK